MALLVKWSPQASIISSGEIPGPCCIRSIVTCDGSNPAPYCIIHIFTELASAPAAAGYSPVHQRLSGQLQNRRSAPQHPLSVAGVQIHQKAQPGPGYSSNRAARQRTTALLLGSDDRTGCAIFHRCHGADCRPTRMAVSLSLSIRGSMAPPDRLKPDCTGFDRTTSSSASFRIPLVFTPSSNSGSLISSSSFSFSSMPLPIGCCPSR